MRMRYKCWVVLGILLAICACAPQPEAVPTPRTTVELSPTVEISPLPEPTSTSMECKSAFLPLSAGPEYNVRWLDSSERLVYSSDREGTDLHAYTVNTGEDRPVVASELDPTPTAVPAIQELIRKGVDPNNIYLSPSGEVIVYRLITVASATPTPIPDGEQFLGMETSTFFLQAIDDASATRVGEVTGAISLVLWSPNSEFALVDMGKEFTGKTSAWIIRVEGRSLLPFEGITGDDEGLIGISPDGTYVLHRQGSKVFLSQTNDFKTMELPFVILARYVWWVDKDTFLFLKPDPQDAALVWITSFDTVGAIEKSVSDISIQVFPSYFPSAFLSPDARWLAYHGKDYELNLLSLCLD